MLDKTLLQTKCPVCRREKQWRQSKIIVGQNGLFVVYHKCAFCSSASLMIVSKSARAEEEGRLVAMEVLTDLEPQEVQSSLEKAPLKADDILDIYQETQEK